MEKSDFLSVWFVNSHPLDSIPLESDVKRRMQKYRDKLDEEKIQFSKRRKANENISPNSISPRCSSLPTEVCTNV